MALDRDTREDIASELGTLTYTQVILVAKGGDPELTGLGGSQLQQAKQLKQYAYHRLGLIRLLDTKSGFRSVLHSIELLETLIAEFSAEESDD